jgi:hypothetical protein
MDGPLLVYRGEGSGVYRSRHFTCAPDAFLRPDFLAYVTLYLARARMNPQFVVDAFYPGSAEQRGYSLFVAYEGPAQRDSIWARHSIVEPRSTLSTIAGIVAYKVVRFPVETAGSGSAAKGLAVYVSILGSHPRAKGAGSLLLFLVREVADALDLPVCLIGIDAALSYYTDYHAFSSSPPPGYPLFSSVFDDDKELHPELMWLMPHSTDTPKGAAKRASLAASLRRPREGPPPMVGDALTSAMQRRKGDAFGELSKVNMVTILPKLVPLVTALGALREEALQAMETSGKQGLPAAVLEKTAKLLSGYRWISPGTTVARAMDAGGGSLLTPRAGRDAAAEASSTTEGSSADSESSPAALFSVFPAIALASLAGPQGTGASAGIKRSAATARLEEEEEEDEEDMGGGWMTSVAVQLAGQREEEAMRPSMAAAGASSQPAAAAATPYVDSMSYPPKAPSSRAQRQMDADLFLAVLRTHGSADVDAVERLSRGRGGANPTVHIPAVAGEGSAAGHTALTFAARLGHVGLVKALLMKGINGRRSPGFDIDRKDAVFGSTAVNWAAYKGHAAVVRLLIDAGASTRVVNCSGDDAYALALSQKCPKAPSVVRAVLKELGPKWPPPVNKWEDRNGKAVRLAREAGTPGSRVPWVLPPLPVPSPVSTEEEEEEEGQKAPGEQYRPPVLAVESGALAQARHFSSGSSSVPAEPGTLPGASEPGREGCLASGPSLGAAVLADKDRIYVTKEEESAPVGGAWVCRSCNEIMSWERSLAHARDGSGCAGVPRQVAAASGARRADSGAGRMPRGVQRGLRQLLATEPDSDSASV